MSLPQKGMHTTPRFLSGELQLTSKAKDTTHSPPSNTARLAMGQHHTGTEYGKNAKLHCFHPLPIQQFQSLLTLFPKSFSSFPHGTCVLLVSNTYKALDEAYHPLCAPISRNVTLTLQAVHKGLQTINKDSHLHWCSFPRGSYLHPCWQSSVHTTHQSQRLHFPC